MTGKSVSDAAANAKCRFAIIGAGTAGLCAAKYLTQAGFADVTIFEIGTQIGGMWCYLNDSNQSSAYRTLHINTAKGNTSFSDFPFDHDVQVFPDHQDMHAYLRAYAVHFDLVPRIRFRSRVCGVSPALDYRDDRPRWSITTERGDAETYDRVIVATGHLSTPNHVKEYQESFGGEYVHTHDYREPDGYVGKRVCIVGVGNSACDIASDVCMVAAETVLVARSGVVIAPKFIFGMPFHDLKLLVERMWLPRRLREWLVSMGVYLVHGSMADLGFKPLTRKSHGTSNPVIVQQIRYNRISVKQGIDRIENRQVHFADGTSDEFDVLMAGTGYLIDLPFLRPDIVSVKDNVIDLYKRIVPPEWRGLFFVGMLNTSTVSIPYMCEQQMRWLLPFEQGQAKLPSRHEMHRDIQAKKDLLAQAYTQRSRHTIEEPHQGYIHELKQSQKAARRRRRAAVDLEYREQVPVRIDETAGGQRCD